MALGLLRLGFAASPPRLDLDVTAMEGMVTGFHATGATSGARYVARGERFALSVAPNDVRLAVVSSRAKQEHHSLRLRLVGANPGSRLAPQDPLPQSHAGRPTYASVRYDDVYPGITARFSGHQGDLQYTFLVDRGADPANVVLELEGADHVEHDAQGAFVVTVGGVRLVHGRPTAFQPKGNGADVVPVEYEIRGPRQVGLKLGEYDIRRPLVVRYGRGTVADVGPSLVAAN